MDAALHRHRGRVNECLRAKLKRAAQCFPSVRALAGALCNSLGWTHLAASTATTWRCCWLLHLLLHLPHFTCRLVNKRQMQLWDPPLGSFLRSSKMGHENAAAQFIFFNTQSGNIITTLCSQPSCWNFCYIIFPESSLVNQKHNC